MPASHVQRNRDRKNECLWGCVPFYVTKAKVTSCGPWPEPSTQVGFGLTRPLL